MLLDHIRRNEISRDRKGVTVALTQFQRNFEQGIYIYIENIATSSPRSFHLDGGEKSLSLQADENWGFNGARKKNSVGGSIIVRRMARNWREDACAIFFPTFISVAKLKKKKYKICSLDVQLKATLLALLIKRMFERESFFSFLLSPSLFLFFSLTRFPLRI